MLQLIYWINLFTLLFNIFGGSPKLNQVIFYETSLDYENNRYYLNFYPIKDYINYINVSIDGKIITEYKNLTSLEQIELYSIGQGAHNVKIEFLTTKYHLVNFNLLIPEEVNITDKSYFNLNSFIDDYNHQLELADSKGFRINELSFEIVENNSYIDFKKFGRFIFDYSEPICDEIEFVIYNQNYFYQFNYDQGYRFNLNLIKDKEGVYLDIYKVKNTEKYLSKLYLPKQSCENVLDTRVILKNIFNSSIDVYFNQLIDVYNYIYGEDNNYEIKIKDI